VPVLIESTRATEPGGSKGARPVKATETAQIIGFRRSLTLPVGAVGLRFDWPGTFKTLSLFAPMFALNFHQFAGDTRVFSVSFSVEDIARYNRSGQFLQEEWQPSARGMHAIPVSMAFRR
jgi:hypothetical protein